MAAALLQLTSVTKSFGAVRALKGVSCDLRAGAPGQPGGLPAFSRGLSAATPPEPVPPDAPHPGGVPVSPVVRALNQHRESPASLQFLLHLLRCAVLLTPTASELWVPRS